MCRKSRSFPLFGNISYGLKAPNVLQLEDLLYTDLWNGKLHIVMIGYSKESVTSKEPLSAKTGGKMPTDIFWGSCCDESEPLKLRLA